MITLTLIALGFVLGYLCARLNEKHNKQVNMAGPIPSIEQARRKIQQSKEVTIEDYLVKEGNVRSNIKVHDPSKVRPAPPPAPHAPQPLGPIGRARLRDALNKRLAGKGKNTTTKIRTK